MNEKQKAIPTEEQIRRFDDLLASIEHHYALPQESESRMKLKAAIRNDEKEALYYGL